METAVIVAIITGVCSVIGQYIISLKNKREDETKRAVKDALIEQRLESIEAKLDEHNGYAKLFQEVSVTIARLETELKAIKEEVINLRK